MNIFISKMTGKLEGIESINTNTINNEFCKKMRKNKNSICHKCYSYEMLTTARQKCVPNWEHNRIVLTTNVINIKELPKINFRKWKKKKRKYFRLSAHGEIENENMYINYINIVKKNPEITFALWTKRKDLVKKYGKMGASNVIFIYSTIALNIINPELPEGFDKVFSVYTAEFVKNNEIDINCASPKETRCLKCMKCYDVNNTEIYINEVIKKEKHIHMKNERSNEQF